MLRALNTIFAETLESRTIIDLLLVETIMIQIVSKWVNENSNLNFSDSKTHSSTQHCITTSNRK